MYPTDFSVAAAAAVCVSSLIYTVSLHLNYTWQLSYNGATGYDRQSYVDFYYLPLFRITGGKCVTIELELSIHVLYVPHGMQIIVCAAENDCLSFGERDRDKKENTK